MVTSLRCIIFTLSLTLIVATGHITSGNDTQQTNRWKSNNALVANPNRLLDNNVVPIHYDIDITLNYDFVKTQNFSGSVKILIELKSDSQPSTSFLINSANIVPYGEKYKLYEVHDPDKKNLIKLATADPEAETVKCNIVDGKTIEAGKTYVLEVNYRGIFNKDLYGFFLNKYKSYQNNDGWVLATQLQPTFARTVFPCFDEPNYKATFKLIVKCPKEYNVLFNTKSEDTIEHFETNTKTWIFRKTPRMSTYLLAIVVSNFTHISTTHEYVEFTAWYPNGKSFMAEFGLAETKENFAAMKRLTGIDPAESFGKIDQVALPELFADGMENWGLITFREATFLYDKNESTALRKQMISTLISHELAHFWFGNLVTLQWWDYAWLNEGFATYYEYRIPAERKPLWELSEQFVLDKHQSALNSDSIKSAKSLNQNASTIQDIIEKFEDLTYNKGASIIRMMEHFMGKKAFDKAIQLYLRTNAGKNVVPENLWNIMDQFATDLPSNIKLTGIMKSYTDQPGLPLITAKLMGANVQLTQKRFLFEDENDTTRYYIPITYTTGDQLSFENTKPKMWMRPGDASIQIPLSDNNALIIVNIQVTAYARVNYDEELWHRIVKALKQENFGGIHVLNRAQLVDDAMNLARAGLLPYKIALDVFSYLENEIAYQPWFTANNALTYLRQRFIKNTREEQLLREFILRLIKRVYNSLQITDHVTLLKKSMILQLACDIEEPYCLKSSHQLYNMWINNKFVIPPETRFPTYCTSLRHAKNESVWNTLYHKFKTTPLQSEALVILSALGCSKDQHLLNGLLMKTIEPESDIQSQDAPLAFSSVISNSPEGLEIGLDFFLKHHQDIANRYGESDVEGYGIDALIELFNLPEHVQKFDTFLNNNPTLAYYTKAKAMMSGATRNKKWSKDYTAQITRFMENFLKHGQPLGNCDRGESAVMI